MPAPDEGASRGAAASTGAVGGAPRAKRRVTVLLSGDPSKPDSQTKAVEISESPRPSARPTIQPPTTATEMMRVAIQSLSTKSMDRSAAISLLHDAAASLMVAQLSAAAPSGGGGHGAVDMDASTKLQSLPPSGSVRGMAPPPPPLRLVDDDQAALHSLDGSNSDLSDAYSDADGGPTPRDACSAPVTRIQSLAVGQALPEVHAARQAAYSWMSAASHGLESCDGSDAATRRTSVSAAERAFAVYPCSKTAAMLSWCLMQYAMVCGDAASRKALEQRAVAVLWEPLQAAEANADPSSIRERVQLLEVLTWVQGLAGDIAAAGAAAAEALEWMPENPELRCILALSQSAEGDLERSEATLLGTLQWFPNHVPTHALLAVLWQWMTSSCESETADETSSSDLVDGALEAMSRFIREGEALVRGTNRTVAGFATVRSTWSSSTALSRRVVEAHLLAADVCCRTGRVLLADAHVTAALECILDFFSDDTSTLVSCAAKALPLQAQTALHLARTQSSSSGSFASSRLESARVAARVRDWLHQAAALSPASAETQLLALVAAEDSVVEGASWTQNAMTRGASTSRASLLQLAALKWDNTNAKHHGESRHDALELLFGASFEELHGPVLPVSVLLPWFSAC